MTHFVGRKSSTTENMPRSKNIDGGWGWMVVLGSFLIHVIADGITYSFGVMIRELLDTFGESKGFTSGINSLLVACTLGSGPIAGAITNRYGCRMTTMVGALIASLGTFLSFFASGILHLYITVGLITGFGFGLMYCPAIIVVTIYFEKRRAFATGIAVCGAGLGTFLFAPLTHALLDRYLWRGTFLIYSGLILNCAACGALFREPETDFSETEDERKNPLLSAHPSALKLDAILEEQEETGRNGSLAPKMTVSAPHTPAKAALKQPGIHTQPQIELYANSADDIVYLQQNLDETHLVENGANSAQTLTPQAPMLSKSWSKISDDPSAMNNPKNPKMKFRRILSEPHDNLKVGGHLNLLSRKDLFYAASLERLEEYKSNPELFRSVTSPPHHTKPKLSLVSMPVEETGRSGYRNAIAEIKHSLRQMLDMELLRDGTFMLFGISNILTSLGMNAPLIFLPHRAETMGVDGEAWILASFGVSNTIGRLIIGYIADRSWANRLMLYNTSLVFCGLSTMLSFLCTDFVSLAIYATLYGLFLSAYVSLTSVILVDLLGLSKLTNAFGLILLFGGMSSSIGAPIAGWIYDVTKNYSISFLFAGVCILLSGLILYPLPCLKKRLEKRKYVVDGSILNAEHVAVT